jgi:hypothetical protein
VHAGHDANGGEREVGLGGELRQIKVKRELVSW